MSAPVLSPRPVAALPTTPREHSGARGRTPRDRAVDAMRAFLLGAVVLLHAFMVGVSWDDGRPVLENAMDGWDGFAPITWVVQIMPLFFVLGGYSAYVHWTRERARGVTAASYVAARTKRLLIPAVGAVVAVAVVLAALTVLHVPADIVATAGFRISQPFWFLGVYIGCTALVPVLVRCHERYRALTLGTLLAGVVAVDIVRGSTGIAAIGLLNMAFVWLLVQQVGFLVADGTAARLSRRALGGVALLAAAGVATLILTGASPADLLSALNPPMSVLVLLGVGQTALFLLARPALAVWAERTIPSRVIGWVNARSMTIYTWHMPVVVVLAGALLFLPAALPDPLSGAWFASRPLWFAVVLAVTAAVAAIAGRSEATRDRDTAVTGRTTAIVAAVIGTGAVVLVLALGSVPSAWVVSGVLLMLAIRLATRRARSHALA